MCGFLIWSRHSVQVGTPLCIPSRDGIDIGKIASMEITHKVVDVAKKGQEVAMKASHSIVELPWIVLSLLRFMWRLCTRSLFLRILNNGPWMLLV